MKRLSISIAFLASTAVFAAVVAGQTWSVGDGMATYQILLSNWHNPNGVTYTGERCDQVGSKCDTQFKADFEIFGCNATEQRRIKQLSWPGPNEESQWQRIGKRKYDPNSLKDFASVNLTGVNCADSCGIIVRMEVIDVDPLHNDLIDKYIGTLPGCRDLQVARYEKQAKYSLPVALESISVALPQVPRHHAPSMDAIRLHQLHLKVRAWGVDPSSITQSGTQSARHSPYTPPSGTTSVRSPYNAGGGTESQTVYGTRYNRTRSSSPRKPAYNPNSDSNQSNDYTSTESSMYGANRERYSSSNSNAGSNFGGAGYDRHGYPAQSSSTYTQRRT